MGVIYTVKMLKSIARYT